MTDIETIEQLRMRLMLATERRKRLEGRLKAAVKALRHVEWKGPNGQCPACGSRGSRHGDKCKVVEVLDP